MNVDINYNHAFATIIASNYLDKALLLKESIQKYSSDIPLFVLVVDAQSVSTELKGNFFTLTDLGLSAKVVSRLLIGYDIVELATSLKPVFLKWVLSNKFKRVTFLDPDIQVFADLDYHIKVLGFDTQTLLTPHRIFPTENGNSKLRFNDDAFLKYGVFNLGFLSVTEKSIPFLDWWTNKLLMGYSLRRPITHLYTDQKWIDLALVFFDFQVIRHPGFNVAPWNLNERQIQNNHGKYYVNDDFELVFAHFSQIENEINYWELTMNTKTSTHEWSYFYKLSLAYNERLAEIRSSLPNLVTIKSQTKPDYSYIARDIFLHLTSYFNAIKLESKFTAFSLNLLSSLTRPFVRYQTFNGLYWGMLADTKRIYKKLKTSISALSSRK